MITAAQQRFIATRAYVPEHLTAYVTAITGSQPYLVDDYVVYRDGDRLIFVGYPLSAPSDDAAWLAAFEIAQGRFRPRLTSLIVPGGLPDGTYAAPRTAPPANLPECLPSPPDAYYRLNVHAVRPGKKLRSLLRRAANELVVGTAASTGREHRGLVDEFLANTPLSDDSRAIFGRLERYAGQSILGAVRRRLLAATAAPDMGRPVILEARDAGGRLVAFDVVAVSESEYAFYLFNFRSRERYVPGASDLLLAELIATAQAGGKRYVNLGLGISPGVSHFKEKWGATAFLAHCAAVCERQRSPWEEALDAL